MSLCCEKPDGKRFVLSLMPARSPLSLAPQLLTLHLTADPWPFWLSLSLLIASRLHNGCHYGSGLLYWLNSEPTPPQFILCGGVRMLSPDREIQRLSPPVGVCLAQKRITSVDLAQLLQWDLINLKNPQISSEDRVGLKNSQKISFVENARYALNNVAGDTSWLQKRYQVIATVN